MLIPANVYKEQIEKAFAQEQYSDRLMWYDGCIDNYDHEIKTECDKYSFAIVNDNLLIGYVSFRVDWYCSMAFNFSLIKFIDSYQDNVTQTCKSSKPIMINAIREIIKMVEGFNLHRLDFRCVSGNPAENGYKGIVKIIKKTGRYNIRIVDFIDNIKDRKGDYHNTIMYELIRSEVK